MYRLFHKNHSFFISAMIFVWSLDLGIAWTIFGLCILSAFSALLGVLLSFNCFSCCFSFLSCSMYLFFLRKRWLVFELLLDNIWSCLYCILFGFCAFNFPRIVRCSFATLVLLVLLEMMWLLYFVLFTLIRHLQIQICDMKILYIYG